MSNIQSVFQIVHEWTALTSVAISAMALMFYARYNCVKSCECTVDRINGCTCMWMIPKIYIYFKKYEFVSFFFLVGGIRGYLVPVFVEPTEVEGD